jgi:H+-transporting ATPase
VGILTQRYNRVLIEQDGLKGTKLSAGLSTAESQERLRQHGPNRVEEERRHPLLTFPGKFWAPVPWMLEATIALGILVHKLDEAVIIGCLLLFNSVLSSVQENQANRALDLLLSRLSV